MEADDTKRHELLQTTMDTLVTHSVMQKKDKPGDTVKRRIT